MTTQYLDFAHFVQLQAQELQNETSVSLEAEWEEVESPLFRDQNNATVTFRNSDVGIVFLRS